MEPIESKPQVITAHLVVYAVTLDTTGKYWKFKFNGKTENVDISETQIAERALERGGVTVGDTYTVKIEITERRTRNDDYRMSYKILEVLEFRPGSNRQQDSFSW